MIIIGIDPGLDGAIASEREVTDMPTLTVMRGKKAKRALDIATLARKLKGYYVRHAFIENVHGMPGQGVTSTCSICEQLGAIKGIMHAREIPFTLIEPAAWKKALGVPAGKDGARARASQLLPKLAHNWPLKKHDGRAEAALIAEYGRRMTAK